MPRLVSTVLGAPDPRALARFHAELLQWPITDDEPDWVTLRPRSGPGLSFQSEENFVRPVWPEQVGAQQMMMHLDFSVDDLDSTVRAAVAAGATVAEHQQQEGCVVLFDPAGHPFCLFVTDELV